METCDYCGYELEPHERVTRGGGRMLCSVCVGRLGAHLDPMIDDMTDLMVKG